MGAPGGYLVTAVAVSPMELASWTRSQALQLRARFPSVLAYLEAQSDSQRRSRPGPAAHAE